MSKRMNIATPRKGKDKTFWVNIGTAWFSDNGQIQLVFDALPLPDAEGRCVANLFEPRERDGQTGQTSAAVTSRSSPTPAYSDIGPQGDVPF